MAVNSTAGGSAALAAQAQRAGAAADDGGVFEVPERVRAEPVDFFRADDQASIDSIFLQPGGAQARPWRKLAGSPMSV